MKKITEKQRTEKNLRELIKMLDLLNGDKQLNSLKQIDKDKLENRIIELKG
ncbi:hypothetical protein [Vagococcus fluvialis]|uniref:hypothetical protein n=1 Tax=Vagococcus fluvialis TaxID=2738 RepID=UPI001D0BD677|nr:hypothetical protein [Vagococcus fluvialis]UDM84070.1 hypothetical protein K5K96_15265 [Vagococcus fluvialis]